MKKRVIVILVVCLNIVYGLCKEITLVDMEDKGISDVSVSFYNEEKDSVGSSLTDVNGIVDISSNIRYVLVKDMHKADKLIDCNDIKNDTLPIYKSNELDDLVVTAGNMQKTLTYESYRIPLESMQSYPNFYQALNEIPHLTVLSSGALFYQGDSNVLVLINGVDASVSELVALSKDDIYRVKVYQVPPPRFAGRGVSSVIDVVTKSSLTGGNLSLDLSQAFYPLKGSNSAAFFYNYKRSRFSFIYDNDNKKYTRARFGQTLDYEFDGVGYKKEKTGLDSDERDNTNSISLSFQNNLQGSYLYNLSLGGTVNRDIRNLQQSVTSNASPVAFRAYNRLDTRYERFWVGNYFEKQIGEEGKSGTFAVNVKLQRLFSKYYSGYSEYEDPSLPETPTIDVFSSYRSRYDAALGEMQYQFPEKSWGQISISAFESFEHSKYLDTGASFAQKSNTAGLMAFYYGSFRKIYYYANFGVSSVHTSSRSLDKSYTYWLPEPNLTLIYYPNRKFQIRLKYSYRGSTPSISQMSETDQWLDTRLVYHGNPGLKPYRSHDLILRGDMNTKYFRASLRVGYTNSPDQICNYYLEANDYILETIVNLRQYHQLIGQADMTVKPLGNNKWTIWTRIIGARIHGEGETYSWNGYRFQWMVNTSVNLKKWNFSAFYQYPGRVAEGQIIAPRAQCWSVEALFRPVQNLSVGMELFMPFGKSFKEGQHTVGSVLVNNVYTTQIRDRANMVSLKLEWNLNFGKNDKSAQPQFDNVTTDTGILKK